MQQRKKIAIIVAGGSGTRMGAAVPKQFLELAGKPVLYHTIAAFINAYADMQVVLVVPEAHIAPAQQVLNSFTAPPPVTLVKGGDTRFHSVQNGLQQVPDNAVVFVHDGVRPLLTTALVHHCYEQTLLHGNAIPVIDMKDSVRETNAAGNKAVNREQFKIIQTPQTFLSEQLLPAFALPYDPLFTDEATVVEKLGYPIHLVPGEERNIKITRPLDLVIAEALLRQ